MENKDNIFKGNIDDFIKLLPTIPILVSLLGIIDQILYYSYFNIDITRYIGISEFLLMDLKLTLIISLMFLLIFPYFVIYQDYINNAIFFSFTKKDIKIFLITVLSVSLIATDLYTDFIEKQAGYIYILIGVISFATIAIFIIFIIRKLNEKIKSQVSTIHKIYILFYSIIISYGLSIIATKNLLLPTYEYKGYALGSYIKTVGDSIRIDSSNFIIGKTSSYIFLRNNKEKSNRIIPMSQVKDIKLIIQK